MILEDAFRAVIADSYDDRNKMRTINRRMSIDRLVDFAVRTDEAFKIFSSQDMIRDACEKLFDRVKAQRPGYVYQDLENIIYLGYSNMLQSDRNKDENNGPGYYEKWFERYGLVKSLVNNDNQRETRRNQWLRSASRRIFLEQNN
ncbi:MAG: hypothetical protein WC428_08565 [Candidatus Paceibacterota bacterium]|jgi:hypothetical protein